MNESRNNKQIAIWLFVCCALILTMVMLGGATRLTRSGLSIVEWRPFTGVVPPLNESQWQETFDKYKQYPEYQKINKGMSLDEFKSIFWFEFFHRLLGRLIGLAFIIPFFVFLLQRKYTRSLTPKLAAMFLLGGLQGLMGWYMVKSGLVDRPHVSQYRLTAHLALAFLIYGFMFWTALGLVLPERAASDRNYAPARRWAIAITTLLCVMILSGGFVAGTKAGFAFNSFPKMNGHWFPPGLYALEPWYLNLFDNIATVQFNHRLIAYLLLIAIPAFWLFCRRYRFDRYTRIGLNLFLAMLLVQAGLGISTLILVVPVSLGTLHQGGALVLLTFALFVNHRLASPPN